MSKSSRGFMTFAQNTDSVDYLRLSYFQALNVKATQKFSNYAVVVDKETVKEITDKHRKVFDHIIELEEDYNSENSTWKLANECQAFRLSPFKETIKVESDLLFTSDISHWYDAFRFKNIVLSTGCRNYHGSMSDVRRYRKIFDDNALPDTYSGLMYFRYDAEAAGFFRLASDIRANWTSMRDEILLNCREDHPSTDVLFALTAKVFGVEACTLPSFDFINFVHMKPGIQGWYDDAPWYDVVLSERDDNMIRINNLNQYHPVHYQNKDYVTDDMIGYYEDRIRDK